MTHPQGPGDRPGPQSARGSAGSARPAAPGSGADNSGGDRSGAYLLSGALVTAAALAACGLHRSRTGAPWYAYAADAVRTGRISWFCAGFALETLLDALPTEGELPEEALQAAYAAIGMASFAGYRELE